MELIHSFYKFNSNYLFEFNYNIIIKLFEVLNIKTEKKLLSELNVDGDKNQLLINILKKVDSNTYLSGEGAKNFIDLNFFNKNKIKVIFNNFKHPIYEQINGNFVKDLSLLDIIFNCGISKTERLIKNA
jgi:hypothetical protein